MVDIDRTGRIAGFEEKPKTTKLRSPITRDGVGSMGVYIFNTDVLLPVLLKDAEDPNSSHDFGKDILPKILEHTNFIPSTSLTRTRRKRGTGATWERLRPITKPTWTWSRFRRYSICMTSTGPSARTSGNIPRPSSSLASPDAPAWPLIPSSAPDALFPAAMCATACSRPTCA